MALTFDIPIFLVYNPDSLVNFILEIVVSSLEEVNMPVHVHFNERREVLLCGAYYLFNQQSDLGFQTPINSVEYVDDDDTYFGSPIDPDGPSKDDPCWAHNDDLTTLVQNAASGSLISYKALLDHFADDQLQTQNIVAMCQLLMEQQSRITELEEQVSQLSNRCKETIDATWDLQQDINRLEWNNRALRRDLDDAMTDITVLEEQTRRGFAEFNHSHSLQRIVNWFRGLFHKPQVPDYDDIPF